MVKKKVIPAIKKAVTMEMCSGVIARLSALPQKKSAYSTIS